MKTITEFLEEVRSVIEQLPIVIDGGVGVVVDNYQDVDSELDEKMGKSKGWVILIGEVSTQNPNQNSPGPQVDLTFGVSIWTPKVIAQAYLDDDKPTGAMLRDAIITELHLAYKSDNPLVCNDVSFQRGVVLEEKKESTCSLIHALSFRAQLQY